MGGLACDRVGRAGIPPPLECPFILVNLASSPCGRNEAGVGLLACYPGRDMARGGAAAGRRLLLSSGFFTCSQGRASLLLFQADSPGSSRTPGESTMDQRQLLGDSALTPLPPLPGTKSLDRHLKHNISLSTAHHKSDSPGLQPKW